MIPNGYAIIDRNALIIQRFSSLPDFITWPNGDRTHPASLTSHGEWSFVECFLDIPTETRDQNLSEMKTEFVGGRIVTTAILVPRMNREIEAWDRERAPRTISWWRGRAMCRINRIEDQIEAVITSIEDPTLKQLAQLAWDGADFQRESPLLNQIFTAIGYKPHDIDLLFIAADEIAF